DDPVAGGAVAQIGLDGDAGASRLLDQPGRLARVVGLLRQVREGDVGALTGVGDGHGAADAGVTSGDERLAPLQPVRADVALLPVVGDRLHRVGAAGGILLLRRESGEVLGHRRSPSSIGVLSDWWVPSHHGSDADLPHRHTALTGRSVRWTVPSGARTPTAPRIRSGPLGQTCRSPGSLMAGPPNGGTSMRRTGAPGPDR